MQSIVSGSVKGIVDSRRTKRLYFRTPLAHHSLAISALPACVSRDLLRLATELYMRHLHPPTEETACLFGTSLAIWDTIYEFAPRRLKVMHL